MLLKITPDQDQCNEKIEHLECLDVPMSDYMELVMGLAFRGRGNRG